MAGIDPRRLLSTNSPLVTGSDHRLISPSSDLIANDQLYRNDEEFLTDQEILDLVRSLDIPPGVIMGQSPAGAAGLKVICSTTPILVAGSSADKKYCGHIAIGPDANGRESFHALYTSGPGSSPYSQAKKRTSPHRALRQAILAINKHLGKKLEGGEGLAAAYASFQEPLHEDEVQRALRTLRGRAQQAR